MKRLRSINFRRLAYRLRTEYLTLNNVVIVSAFIIAASWVWGSIGVMQRNYLLQREINSKQQQEQLVELETQNLELQQKYYKSTEYQELAVRERLGLGDPGENVLILPPNTAAAEQVDKTVAPPPTTVTEPSNLQQWLTFLFGNKS